MSIRFLNENSLKIVLGIPIILLLLSLLLENKMPDALVSETQINPFLKKGINIKEKILKKKQTKFLKELMNSVLKKQ